jgi:hypothetical protein
MKRKKTPPGFVCKTLPSGRIVFAIQRKSLDIRTVHIDVCVELDCIVKFTNQFNCVKFHLARSNRYFWKIDLRAAFDHVTFESISSLKDLPDEVRYTPSLFFHENGGLIQGAPASPKLFQLFCQQGIDPIIKEFCKRNTLFYTRYADDLLFSSKVPIGKGARERIRRIIRESGFQVNEDKVKLVDTHKEHLVYLGMDIFRGKISPTEAFFQKLDRVPIGASQTGMLGWKNSILACNR